MRAKTRCHRSPNFLKRRFVYLFAYHNTTQNKKISFCSQSLKWNCRHESNRTMKVKFTLRRFLRPSSLLFFVCIIHCVSASAFVPRNSNGISSSSSSSSLSLSIFSILKPAAVPSPSVSIKSYHHKNWKLTHRYKPASPGFEDESPLLLIHPVGIGLSSWFWERVMDAWTGPAMYAPNLIGCGVQEGSDPWDPDQQGLSFPLGWVQGCETLMQESSTSGALPLNTFTVVVQGGLAPVGLLLASRNPQTVGKLIFASPPRWKEMTTSVPQVELERNYNFLRSPVLGNLAFSFLESRKAVEFFSNQFLFSEPCDEEWLEKGEKESCVEARPPVMAFNAGFCNHRSFEKELLALEQPTLVVGGEADKRQRQEYTEKMNNCILTNIPGQNVLPWESPELFVEAINNF